MLILIFLRSAGDVLQDIGSMLSDLTDELDAMLKLDKEDQWEARVLFCLPCRQWNEEGP